MVTYTEWHIPDAVLINWYSWLWARGCSKHVENLNKHIEKELCVKLVIYQESYKMHGPQNLKQSSCFLTSWERIKHFFSCGALTRFWVLASSFEALRWHSLDTQQSVDLLQTSDQSDAQTFNWQRTTLTTYRHPSPGGIRTKNPSKWAGADPRLRPRGHWDRQSVKPHAKIQTKTQ